MSDAINEIKLLKNCLKGHTEGFDLLVGRYQSLVCAITYSATGDVEKSEELAQETFLLAWKNLGQLKDLAKFKAWLCTIARRHPKLGPGSATRCGEQGRPIRSRVISIGPHPTPGRGGDSAGTAGCGESGLEATP